MPDDLNARVERLEESERRAWAAIKALADATAGLVDKEEKLDHALVVLTESHIKLADSQMRLDERFDKLVSAIGELIRQRNGGTH
jgi:chaperonin cofactor prefoldin